MKLVTVPIEKIIPDDHQPRKYFDTAKMASIRKSVAAHGILTPLSVEETGDTFLLVDGERRLRAARELGMKEVPVIVMEATDGVSRLIEQFHIQEMHEEWTPMEKAGVIVDLTMIMKIPFLEACNRLNIDQTLARKYYAITKLLAKDDFNNKNISLDYASSISSVTQFTKLLKQNVCEENFTLTEQKALEKSVIKNIADGKFTTTRDVVRLKDIFKSNPKTIESFIAGADVQDLYIKSKAKSAYHLRNISNSSGFIVDHVTKFLEQADVKPTEKEIDRIRGGFRALKKLIEFIGEDE